ncbi:hypothetical protein ACFW9S_37175 [Streptomyces anulatus]|uniref:hypothetical protein n=1 Tax=Streptomyces anulatus TaxID=1892 RepID=UPI0036BED345
MGRTLTTATEGRPRPGWPTDDGGIEDIGWHQARAMLLEAVARHHHAHLLAAIAEPGGELVLPTTRNGRFRGAITSEGCAVSAGAADTAVVGQPGQRAELAGKAPVRSTGSCSSTGS